MSCPEQLIAGRTAQEDNRRKNRRGAFWEDRYHAMAIQADDHLHQCVVYIDLNMVRAGVVKHPRDWEHSGYREIHKPPSRYLSPTFAAHCWSLSNRQISHFDLQGLMHEPSKNLLIF
jgi:hypothetical protein